MEKHDDNLQHLQQLTNTAIETLQRAFLESHHAPVEGLILSALVTVKQVQEELGLQKDEVCEYDPCDYCVAV
jgi:hypothetical protein